MTIKVCKYLSVKYIKLLHPSLSPHSASIFAPSLVTTCTNYCSSLFFGLPQTISIIFSCLNCYGNIFIHCFRERRWLPLKFRFQFKIILFILKVINLTLPLLIWSPSCHLLLMLSPIFFNPSLCSLLFLPLYLWE